MLVKSLAQCLACGKWLVYFASYCVWKHAHWWGLRVCAVTSPQGATVVESGCCQQEERPWPAAVVETSASFPNVYLHEAGFPRFPPFATKPCPIVAAERSGQRSEAMRHNASPLAETPRLGKHVFHALGVCYHCKEFIAILKWTFLNLGFNFLISTF